MPDFPSIDAIRKRPSMYIGDTSKRGQLHLLGELTSNSIDEFLRAHATRIRVDIDGDVITVTDDGSGLPFDQPSQSNNGSLATDRFLEFHDRPSVDNHAPHVHIHSIMGMGLVVVCALSESLIVESWRDGVLYRQSFCKGHPISAVEKLDRADVVPFFPSKVQPNRGTKVRFKLDPEIFATASLDAASVRKFLFDSVYLIPGLILELQDECLHAPDGLAEFAVLKSSGPVNQLFHLNQVVDGISIDAVAVGHVAANCKTTWHTWANGMPTVDFGTHYEAFSKSLKAVGWNPETALIHVIAYDAQFAGPTKGKLSMPEEERSMTQALTVALTKFCQREQVGKFQNTDS